MTDILRQMIVYVTNSTVPKPPLCKGRWVAERRLGGVVAVEMYLVALNCGEYVVPAAQSLSLFLC